eukprot:6213945-Pleurochrysis_carterae.AAC.3
MPHPGAALPGAYRLQRSAAAAELAVDAAWQGRAQGLNPDRLPTRAHPLCPCLHYVFTVLFAHLLAHLRMPSFFGLTNYYTPKLTIAVARVLLFGDQTGKCDNSFLDKRLDGGFSIMEAMSAAELSPLLVRFKEPGNSGPVYPLILSNASLRSLALLSFTATRR